MKIVVLVKQVPDTWEERKLDVATGRVDRDASPRVIDEIGERALEVALQAKDANGDIEVVVLSMGPAPVEEGLRKCLATGADRAVHVVDDGLAGADLGLTAEAIAAAVKTVGFDLVLAGNESTDGRGAVIPSMVAEHLGVPAATQLATVEIGADAVSGTRAAEGGVLTLRAPFPAVASVTEAAPELRFAGFKGIMAAKKKPIDTYTLADLGVTAPAAASVVLEARERPPREAGIKIVDTGDAARELAEYLVANRLV